MNNQELSKLRNEIFPKGVACAHPIYVKNARNSELWDVEGRRYIDFCAGIAVVNTGHCHPQVIEAINKQLPNFIHTCFQVVGYESALQLGQRLIKLAPGKSSKKIFFMNTGAEAVENAIKVARAYTNRSGIIAFNGSFHGRTMFSLALTGKVNPYKTGFGPYPGEIFHAPFPMPKHGISEEQAIAGIENIFKNDIEAARVAAIIIEPVQGEGGYLSAPFSFLQKLRAICDQHKILLIADEVQSGIARTGKMFACEHAQIEPDIITLAKGLGGGTTISAIIGKAEIIDAAIPGALGSTYAGNPLAIAAANKVLDIVEQEKLCERSIQIGETIKNFFNKIAKEFNFIADVRGLGAMVAVEFAEAGDLQKPAADIATKLKLEAFNRGLLLLNCGSNANVLRLMTPLTISDDVLNEGLQIIYESLLAL